MTDALVSTTWLSQHAGNSGLRIFEASQEPSSYASGHVERSLPIDWKQDLIEAADESSGKVIDAGRFVALASRLGFGVESERRRRGIVSVGSSSAVVDDIGGNMD